MRVNGVIFDMGGTLLRYHPAGGNWEAMEKAGAQGLFHFLQRLDYTLPPLETMLEQTWQQMRAAWLSLKDIEQDQMPTLQLAYQLRLLLQQWAIPVSDELLLMAEHAYNCAAQVYVRPFADALDTVRTLHERGFTIGLISNTLWRGTAHQYDLTYYGIWPYLQVALFSGDELAWKPYPTIFQRALAQLNLRPEETVYVGDSLFFDVHGCQQAGLRGIWIEQSEIVGPPMVEEIQPDATIQTLSELLTVLEKGA